MNSAQSRPWTLFRSKKGHRHKDRKKLTEPKPDWVAFFPIYSPAGERITTPKRWHLDKVLRQNITENFSVATLRHLARREVQSNTAGLFRKTAQRETVLSDYVCFPWLIVEHKKAGGAALEETCYCQAANAGSAAVMMLETLSTIVPGENQDANKHIPPVVTVTTVAEVVRVWIAYSSKPSENDTAKYVSKILFLPSLLCLL